MENTNGKRPGRRSMRRLILYVMFFCILLFLIVGLAGLFFLSNSYYLDVMMPGATGLEVIDAVQDENCRFIIVSGYQEFEYVRHALRAGVVDYLLKPLSASELSAALSRLLGGKRTARKIMLPGTAPWWPP